LFPGIIWVASSLAAAVVIAMSGFGLPIFSAIYFSLCAYITLETIVQELDEWASPLDGVPHLLICRESSGRLLRVGDPAIDFYFKDTAARPAQIDLCRRLQSKDHVPRRTGARLVASLAAVFDLDFHGFARRSVLVGAVAL